MAQYDLPRTNNRVEVQPPPVQTAAQAPLPLPVAPPPASTKPMKGDPRGLAGFIRETAIKYGIDPEVALKVARSEGLAQFYGDGGASGGAFQLYTKGGLGNEFQKETGLNPLDQKNEQATIDYALKRASQVGWGPWYGAKKVGVGEFDGIKALNASATPTPLDPTPNVGSGASDYVTPADTASTTTPDDGDTDKKDKKSKNKWGEAAGEGLENVAKAYAAGAKKDTASSPANVPAPILPMPQGPVSMIDAKRAEMQRQQLAMAMQRLNSGRLV